MATTRALPGSGGVFVPGADLYIVGLMLALGSLPLLYGRVALDWILLPERVAAGEWWRIFTYPFVHVSGYHLLLDGLAFWWLYAGVGDNEIGRRLLYLAGAAGGATVAALLWSPRIAELGLCGLSGVDHGLMAVCGLELWRGEGDHRQRLLGSWLTVAVFAKALAEVLLGQPLFALVHLGDVGVPLVVCHLGGALGGTLAFAATRLRKSSAP